MSGLELLIQKAKERNYTVSDPEMIDGKLSIIITNEHQQTQTYNLRTLANIYGQRTFLDNMCTPEEAVETILIVVDGAFDNRENK